MRRRVFVGRLGVAAAACVLTPLRVQANWSPRAFESATMDAALTATFGRSDTVTALEIELKLPTTAHLGDLVPVMVQTHLPNVSRMALLVHENPQPLAALFEFGPSTLAEVAARIRLAQSSEVSVVVESDGQLFRNAQPVQVVLGGCGGASNGGTSQ
jgi:sulfur-oxidizing protein SoxY